MIITQNDNILFQNDSSPPQIIIPAAGFGTRVGSPHAKELFIDPITKKPLIHRALNLAAERNWPVHVITRPEKTELIDYLNKFPSVYTQIVSKTKEWPDSILKSAPFWQKKNILILPDTLWDPQNAIDEIFRSLNTNPIAIGAFEIDKNQSHVWGVIKNQTFPLEFCEKDQSTQLFDILAWGIIGFTSDIGIEYFTKLQESTFDHQWKFMESKFEMIRLNTFADLTRI